MVKKKRKLKEMQWFPNLFLQKQHFEFFLRSEKSTKSKNRRKLVQKVEAFILETDPFILFFFLVAGTVDDFF